MLNIFVEPSLWDLPSSDPSCLSVLFYCQYANIRDYKVFTSLPGLGQPSDLPQVHITHENYTLQGQSHIISYLEKNLGSIDDFLTQDEKDLSHIISQMVGALSDGIICCWWINEQNRSNMIRLKSASKKNFGLSFSSTDDIYQNALEHLRMRYGQNLNHDNIVEIVKSRVEKTFNSLEHLLKKGKAPFFFSGDRLSVADIILFSHLILIQNSNLGGNWLAEMMHSRNNLTLFVSACKKKLLLDPLFSDSINAHFGEPISFTQQLVATFKSFFHRPKIGTFFHSNSKKSKSKRKMDFRTNIAIFGAISATVFYIWRRGLISISIETDEEEES